MWTFRSIHRSQCVLFLLQSVSSFFPLIVLKLSAVFFFYFAAKKKKIIRQFDKLPARWHACKEMYFLAVGSCTVRVTLHSKHGGRVEGADKQTVSNLSGGTVALKMAGIFPFQGGIQNRGSLFLELICWSEENCCTHKKVTFQHGGKVVVQVSSTGQQRLLRCHRRSDIPISQAALRGSRLCGHCV